MLSVSETVLTFWLSILTALFLLHAGRDHTNFALVLQRLDDLDKRLSRAMERIDRILLRMEQRSE